MEDRDRLARAGLIACVIGFAAAILLPDARGNAPKPVRPGSGIRAAVTAHPNATSAAMKILSMGGSAADAAVAAQMVLGVVEPQSSGLGGGAIVLYREARHGPIHALDGLARSSAAYEAAVAATAGYAHSGAAVGVPGTLRVMELLHSRYGKLPWAALFDSAIDLADKGFPTPAYLARSLAAAMRAGFVPPAWLRDPTGHAVTEGTMIRNPELAAMLREVAEHGVDALYVGSAPAIASAVRSGPVPGVTSPADLTAYSVAEREPICTDFHALKFCAFPPPSYGGIAVLELLSILERLKLRTAEFLNVEFLHRFIEAGRIAQADRFDLVGDPDAGASSVLPLLDANYLDRRAKLVSGTEALRNPVQGGVPPGLSRPRCTSAGRPTPPSTSQVVIIDDAGAALSMTTTINVNFGAWLAVKGFFLNNAMTNFSPPGDRQCPANRPTGEKRPETSMAPVIAMNSEGETMLIGGSAGGGEIVDYIAQAIVGITHGMSPLEALDAGHISTARAPYSDSPGLVELEQGRGVAELASALRSLGHEVKIAPLQSGLGFLVRKNGDWLGAADPRRDGDWSVAR